VTLLPSTSTTTVDTGVWILTQGTPRTNATGFWAASEIDGATMCEGAGEAGVTDAGEAGVTDAGEAGTTDVESTEEAGTSDAAEAGVPDTGEAGATDAGEVAPAGDAARGETGRAKWVAEATPDGD